MVVVPDELLPPPVEGVVVGTVGVPLPFSKLAYPLNALVVRLAPPIRESVGRLFIACPITAAQKLALNLVINFALSVFAETVVALAALMILELALYVSKKETVAVPPGVL